MRRIEQKMTQPPYDTAAWRLYTEELTSVVFDIETTGLSSSRDSLILGGAADLGASGRFHQYLAASPREEAEVLSCYLETLSGADIWISYNGDSFDRPFLRQRLRRYHICESLPLHQSIDLYRLFRRYSPMAKRLPDLRQTTLETALGLSLYRQDTISGKESAALYEEYACSGSLAAEERILLHNRDDLLMLHRLMVVLNKLDLDRIMFQSGFLTGFADKRILANKITLMKNLLMLEGHTRGIPHDYDVYEEAFHWSHRAASKSFTLSIPCLCENNAVFVDSELFLIDFTPLEVYPCFVGGYLLLRDGTSISHRAVNHLIKIILKDILKKI